MGSVSRSLCFTVRVSMSAKQAIVPLGTEPNLNDKLEVCACERHGSTHLVLTPSEVGNW